MAANMALVGVDVQPWSRPRPYTTFGRNPMLGMSYSSQKIRAVPSLACDGQVLFYQLSDRPRANATEGSRYQETFLRHQNPSLARIVHEHVSRTLYAPIRTGNRAWVMDGPRSKLLPKCIATCAPADLGLVRIFLPLMTTPHGVSHVDLTHIRP